MHIEAVNIALERKSVPALRFIQHAQAATMRKRTAIIFLDAVQNVVRALPVRGLMNRGFESVINFEATRTCLYRAISWVAVVSLAVVRRSASARTTCAMPTPQRPKHAHYVLELRHPCCLWQVFWHLS